jgi:hypothetical protein
LIRRLANALWILPARRVAKPTNPLLVFAAALTFPLFLQSLVQL